MFSSEARLGPIAWTSAAVIARGGVLYKAGGRGAAVLSSYFWCEVCAGNWTAAVRHGVKKASKSMVDPEREVKSTRQVRE